MPQRGDDPRQAEAEAERRQLAASANTFGYLAEQFMEEHVEKKLRFRTQNEYRRILLDGPDTAVWQSRKITDCSAPGSLDTSLSHAAGLIEIAACHA